MKKSIVFVAILSLFAMCFASPVFTEDKWEYKMVDLTEDVEEQLMAMSIEQMNKLLSAFVGEEIKEEERIDHSKVIIALYEKRLNELGNKGWELVGSLDGVTILKRKKRDYSKSNFSD